MPIYATRSDGAGSPGHARSTGWVWPAALVALCAVLAAVVAESGWALGTLSIWWSDSLWGLEAMLRPLGAATDAQSALAHKFQREGRWLNLLLANLLVGQPGWLLLAGTVLSLALFVRAVAVRFGAEPPVAAAVALLALLAAPLWSQWLWPATALPAFLLLVLAVPLSRLTAPVPFFLLFGVLYLGLVSWPYFLLALLWLPWVLAERPIRRLAIVLASWVGGFVGGFAAMHGMLWLLAGRTSLEIADWRNASPATDLDSLMANLASRGAFLAEAAAAFAGPWPVAGLLAALLVARIWHVGPFGSLPVLVLAVSAALSHFAATVPVGIRIQPHSLGVFYVPLVLLIFAWRPPGMAMRALWLAGACAFASVHATGLRADIGGYVAGQRTLTEAVRQAAPRSPESYAGALLVRGAPPASGRPVAEGGSMEVLAWAPAWVLPARHAGFHAALICEGLADGCVARLGGREIPPCEADGTGHCVHGETADGWLILTLPDRSPEPVSSE